MVRAKCVNAVFRGIVPLNMKIHVFPVRLVLKQFETVMCLSHQGICSWRRRVRREITLAPVSAPVTVIEKNENAELYQCICMQCICISSGKGVLGNTSQEGLIC